MKRIIILITLTLITFSCKNKEENKELETVKTEVPETSINKAVKIYNGDFMYLADAAVLKGKDFIYAVELDKKMQELADRVRPVKQSDFDMVPVAVKGFLSPKAAGEEGWDEVLTITEIVMVGKAPSKVDIKLEGKK